MTILQISFTTTASSLRTMSLITGNRICAAALGCVPHLHPR